MRNLKKLSLILSLITILCILIWFDKSSSIEASRKVQPSNKVVTSENYPTKIKTNLEDKPVNLEKLKLRVPAYWVKRSGTMQVNFQDISKKNVGGVQLVGYYGEQAGGYLPNHSTIVSREEVTTNLGKCKIYILNRSNSVASGDNETWFELHAIIPIKNKELAYDFWIIGKNKFDLLNMLNGVT